jgi:hypothetical protein
MTTPLIRPIFDGRNQLRKQRANSSWDVQVRSSQEESTYTLMRAFISEDRGYTGQCVHSIEKRGQSSLERRIGLP